MRTGGSGDKAKVKQKLDTESRLMDSSIIENMIEQRMKVNA